MSIALKIIDQPEPRAERLARMDLDEVVILRALDLAIQDRKACTAFDPPYYAGVTRSARTVRYLREGFVPRGWGYTDARNYSLLLHPTGVLAIAVATGNEATGDPFLMGLRLAHGKGEMTGNAVNANEDQLSLFDVMGYEGDDQVESVSDGRITWLLLINERSGRLHSELALPRTFCDKNVTAWAERIMLPTIVVDDDPVDDRAADKAKPIEVDGLVRRRDS